jgi:undecaprenyl-diphosphatase
MPLFHAILLGITQGLSEFLPISSSGHLLLVPWLFGWHDLEGQESLKKAFDVALHMGTLAGALAYFRADVARYTKAGLGGLRAPRSMSLDGRIAWMLVGSAVPAAAAGALLDTQLEKLSDDIWLIAVLLIAFGLLLLVADRMGGDRPIESVTPRDAMLTGVAQVAALFPGVSRSGVTITMARKLGLSRDAAARFSFLMSLIVIAGAGIYKLGSVLAGDGIPGELRGAFIGGMIASAVTGWFAVWATLKFVRSRSFAPFTAYRVIIGVGVLALLATGVR